MLEGTWHLMDWRIEQEGRTTRPFGEGATGMLIYAADGHMSAAISAAGRARFSTGNPRTSPAAEQAAALRSYFHYAGTWALLPGPKVVHRVTLALNPGFVGTEQIRGIDLAGDVLTLSAAEGPRRHRMVWRR